LQQHKVGALRIACLPALVNGYLPRFLAAFLASRPDIQITLFGMPTVGVLDWIASGQCDIGFAELPIDHPLVRKEPRPVVPVVAAIRSGHALARRSALRVTDLHGQALIGFTPTTILCDRMDRMFAQAGVQPSRRVETPLSMIACAFIAAGLGIALVDPFTGREFARSGVETLAFTPRIDVEFTATYSVQRELPGLARELLDAFHAEVARFATGFHHKASWPERPVAQYKGPAPRRRCARSGQCSAASLVSRKSRNTATRLELRSSSG
jgi:DNA-binding transcriptional LysR family regulator